VVHIQTIQENADLAESLPDDHPDTTPDLPDLGDLPPMRGEGSGFVWDRRGHIVTNNHVISGAEKITAIFSDDTQVEATLVGADPDSDLAVLEVDLPASQLQPVERGDSGKLQVGEMAIAIGNPFGQEGTMTVGIISALGRLLPVESGNPFAPRYNIPDVIQTDAAINPGNSGGVLLNGEGQVIGVTSAIISSVRASSGIGFAIPTAIVQQVVPALIADGHYDHPFLGISGGSLLPDVAEAMDLPRDQRGTLVADVVPGGPAEAAGLQGSEEEVEIDGQTTRVGGDVIIAMEGQPIQDMDDLIAHLERDTKVGKKIDLTILRQGEELTVKVKLAARPEREPEPVASESEGVSGENTEEAQIRPWFGVLGLPLLPELAEAMELPAEQTGLMIVQIDPDSPADEAGLMGSYKPKSIDGNRFLIGGDVITAINGTEISTITNLVDILKESSPGDDLDIDLLRDGTELHVTVTLEERPD
jgi:S1-C subfamily serine protease